MAGPLFTLARLLNGVGVFGGKSLLAREGTRARTATWPSAWLVVGILSIALVAPTGALAAGSASGQANVTATSSPK
jgi:hypothetical protein